ncbi:uncharacterized protein LOC125381211 [Haliotis rufescens]|uniref:uncharacterized protein LOC125381211 n=1 Tax=Haliotis rufescens TaxID=6454 RepID=UPI00201ED7DB|nr:uncharacterized protein LOC125381211 [Haliotis rufescens]
MKSELTRNKNNLMKKYDEIEALVDKQKTRSKEESTRYLQMESDIKSTTKKAIDMIKRKERKLLDELKEMSDEYIRQLKADIKSGELSIKMYQLQAELIDHTLQSECDMDVYEMYQGCEDGDVDAVGNADLKEKGRIASIMFRQDMDKLSRAVDDLQLGEIDVLYESVLNLKATPVLQGTLDVRVAGDGKAAHAIDITVLVVNGTDTVVVTDFNNTNMKSFYTRNNKVSHSKLSLSSEPYCVTKVKHNQVAVTVPDTRQIVTVEVNPDLVLLSTISTNKQYIGITSLTSSTLAAGSQSPPCVDILDMSGHVLRSISPLHSGNNILQSPSYLCTTRKGDILVSDWGSRCIVCLTPGGDVVFTYSPTGDTALKWPRGITSTSTGDILVTQVPAQSHLSD